MEYHQLSNAASKFKWGVIAFATARKLTIARASAMEQQKRTAVMIALQIQRETSKDTQLWRTTTMTALATLTK